MKVPFGTIASSILKKFIDNFNRTTSGSLGTSSGGGAWTAIKGIWSANGTVGTSADAATTYPIATASMGTSNVTVDLDVDTAGGTGVAFWVTDASNWWGLFPYTAINTSYYSACNSWTQTGPSYSCAAWTQSSSTVCSAWTAGAYYSVCNSFSSAYDGFRGVYYSVCNSWTTGGGGSTCSGYTTSYFSSCSSSSGPFYGSACNTYTTGSTNSAGTISLRLIKSVTNTITTVLDQTLPSLPASVKLITSGTSITGRAYSTAGQVTQIGTDLTSTQTAGGTQHGIILAPGGYTQGTTVDNITISV
jgi:hypothetical protein